MAEPRAQLLNRAETLQATKDARIVALRWDLFAWCLVLDCDATTFDEMDSNEVYRLWIVFDSVSEVSLSLDSARLPSGICAISPIWENALGDNYSQFDIAILTPKFSESDDLLGNPHGNITIKAKDVFAVRSVVSADFGELSSSFCQRNSLADENDLIEAMKARP